MSRELFKTEDEAKQSYILFFTIMNRDCQRELFQLLLSRLKDSANAYNPYDTSESAAAFAASYVEHQVTLWKQSFGVIFNQLDQDIFRNFVTVVAPEGKTAVLQTSDNAHSMFLGTLPADFLINHPLTELQFHRFIMKKIIHDEVKKEQPNV